jgi:tRNA uridine 5-carbamoylmethylation protein Kti12
MPLVIVSGFPSCGKTTFANELAAHLRNNGVHKVKVVNEESENVNKRDGYNDAANEKKTRGALKSAVDHALDTECVVIVDSMNYIKGYRYELFCIARSLRTPHCCVWVESDDKCAEQWNEERKLGALGDAAGYTAEMLTELRRRFEPPTEKNRWDSPLFRVNMTPKDDQLNNMYANISSMGDVGVGVGEVAAQVSALSISKIPDGATSVFRCTEANTAIASTTAATATDPAARSVSVTAAPKTSWKPKAKPIAASTTTAGTGSEVGSGSWIENASSSASVATSASTAARTMQSSSFRASNSAATASAGADQAQTADSASSSSSSLWFSGARRVIESSEGLGLNMSREDVMTQIHQHLLSTPLSAPNSATISVPKVEADLLYELDRTSQNITQRIITHQKENVEGTPLVFAEHDRTLALHRHVGLVELQRHRRQFVKANSAVPPKNAAAAGSLYIDFLALHL